MRILDVGGHDGFVSTWLGRQIKTEKPDEEIHIDGIEANSQACEIANRRLKELGFGGEFKVGIADDLPHHFVMGSYDSVLAYEIIEHVPDVEKFLGTIEYMAKSDVGRVYISTPDGTFGEGNNPHHLRAYRSIDLFDLVRRRGEVLDMEVGTDTISSVSYRPRLWVGGAEVAIYCGPGWEGWHPSDIESRGLGGSETAAVRLGEALSELGYVVTVYGEMSTSGAWDQVSFRRWDTFDPTEKRYMTIVSRMCQILDRPINSEKVVFWAHDTDYGHEVTPERFKNVDAIMVLSNWHQAHWCNSYPWSAEKVNTTKNGIHLPYFEGDGGEDFNPHRAIYSSSPDRGLDFILDIWPEVRERVADAELYFCYSDVYNKVADQNPALGRFRDRVRGLSEQDGVTNLGSLPQNALARAMRDCGVWLAPSYNSVHEQRFYETFCIGAVEAAAAGCITVTSDWGALSERTEADYPIKLDSYDEKPDREQWIAAICHAMTSRMSGCGIPEGSESWSWSRVAEDIIAAADSQ
jgi:glycosyltransferase involved in cell wall biosynthesis